MDRIARSLAVSADFWAGLGAAADQSGMSAQFDRFDEACSELELAVLGRGWTGGGMCDGFDE